jgi:hypothetical protein
VEILHESAAKLGELKDQLESLVKFFSGIETTIENTALDDVKTFLDTIERNSTHEDEQMTMRKLGNTTKRVGTL